MKRILRTLSEQVGPRLEVFEACASLWLLWEKTLTEVASRRMTGDQSSKMAEGGNIASQLNELFAFAIPGIRQK